MLQTVTVSRAIHIVEALINQRQKEIQSLEQQMQTLQNTPFIPSDLSNLDQRVSISRQMDNAKDELDLLNRSLQWLRMNTDQIKRRIHELWRSLLAMTDDMQKLISQPSALAKELQSLQAKHTDLFREMTGLIKAIDAEWIDSASLAPYAIVYDQPQNQGAGWLFVEDVADFLQAALQVQSIRVGSGVTLYKGANYADASQDIYADIPQFMPPVQSVTALIDSPLATRLGGFPRSIKLWDAAARSFTGAYAISVGNDTWLSLRGRNDFTTVDSVGMTECFMIDTLRELEAGTSYEVVLSVVEIQAGKPIKRAITFQGKQSLVMTYKGNGIPRRFTLKAGNRWLTFDAKVRLFTLTDDPRRCQFFTLPLKLAANESQVGSLDTGEVALYEHPNYWGRAWIVNGSLPNFVKIVGLNDVVSSIRVGPSTGVTLYRDVWGQGVSNADIFALPNIPLFTTQLQNAARKLKEDVFENQPTLLNSQIGLNQASAIQTWQMVEAVPYTAVLSQDYRVKDGFGRSYSAYRVSLQLPADVSQVWVNATDMTTIEAGGTRYAISEDINAELNIPSTRTLVITMVADSLKAPALRIRTDRMAANSYFLVYTDSDAHQRVKDMETDALWNAKRPDGNILVPRDKFNKAQIGSFQRALQVAVGSIRYDKTPVPGGQQTKRSLSTAHFEGNAFALSVAPASSAGIQAAVNTSSNFQWLSGTQLAQTKSALNLSGQSTASALRSDIKGFLDDLGDAFEEVIVEPIIDAGEDALQVIIKGGSAVGTFILNTAEKVIKFAEGILHKIGVRIQEFITYLQFLFEWGDILKTQGELAAQLTKILSDAKTLPEKMKKPIQQFLSTVEGQLLGGLDHLIEMLGGTAPEDISGDDTPDWVKQVLEKLYWVLSKVEEAFGSDDSNKADQTPDFVDIFMKALEKSVGIGSGAIAQFKDEASNLWSELKDNPRHAPTFVATTMVEALRTTLNTAIEMLKVLVAAGLDILVKVLDYLYKAITEEMKDVPFFSGLFRSISGGQNLSLLNLVTLILAIPVTVGKKLSDGSQSQQRTAIVRAGKAVDNAAKGLEITAQVCDVIAGVVSGFLDVIPPGAEMRGTGVMEGVVYGASILTYTFNLAAVLIVDGGSIHNFEADNSVNSWATSVAIYEGTMLAVDTVTMVIGLFSGKPSMGRRSTGGGKSDLIGPALGLGLGVGHMITVAGYHYQAQHSSTNTEKPSDLETASAIIAIFPELFSVARIKQVIESTYGLSLAALGALDWIHSGTVIMEIAT